MPEGGGIRGPRLEFAAVGFGSYHWIATDPDGTRHFITVDDLDEKAGPGGTCDLAFEAFQRAFDTVVALRYQEGLEFVVAPIPTTSGEAIRRLGERHSLALFPYIDGHSGPFGTRLSTHEQTALIGLLARLHQVAPSAVPTTPAGRVQPVRRAVLEEALQDLHRPWTGGPFSEPARALLSDHAARVRQVLDAFDDLAVTIAGAGRPSVITHGEPHPGNIVNADGGALLLIDWETVRLAPPERDLWMLDLGADGLAMYAEASGRPADPAALALYRIRWYLDDLSIFVNQFRSAHRQTADVEHAWRSFAGMFETGSLLPRGGAE